jgi:hypothetical protein
LAAWNWPCRRSCGWKSIAKADGSCGWVAMLCAGAGWFAGFLPPTLAREVVATPRMCLAGSGAATAVAERTADGWRINGRWRARRARS